MASTKTVKIKKKHLKDIVSFYEDHGLIDYSCTPARVEYERVYINPEDDRMLSNSLGPFEYLSYSPKVSGEVEKGYALIIGKDANEN